MALRPAPSPQHAYMDDYDGLFANIESFVHNGLGLPMFNVTTGTMDNLFDVTNLDQEDSNGIVESGKAWITQIVDHADMFVKSGFLGIISNYQFGDPNAYTRFFSTTPPSPATNLSCYNNINGIVNKYANLCKLKKLETHVPDYFCKNPQIEKMWNSYLTCMTDHQRCKIGDISNFPCFNELLALRDVYPGHIIPPTPTSKF